MFARDGISPPTPDVSRGGHRSEVKTLRSRCDVGLLSGQCRQLAMLTQPESNGFQEQSDGSGSSRRCPSQSADGDWLTDGDKPQKRA